MLSALIVSSAEDLQLRHATAFGGFQFAAGSEGDRVSGNSLKFCEEAKYDFAKLGKRENIKLFLDIIIIILYKSLSLVSTTWSRTLVL